MKIRAKRFILIIIALLAIFIVSDLYFKQSPDYVKFDFEKSFTNTEDFIKEHSQYYGRVVEIIGQATKIDYGENRIFLNDKFTFSFNDISLNDSSDVLRQYQTLKIKARYIGYDDLFDEYSFDSSVVLESVKE